MDELLSFSRKELTAVDPIRETVLPDELARTRYPLGALDLVCRNWKSEKLEKVYAMRMKVKIPWLDILGMALHPKAAFDIPLFQFDLSCTRKKIIAYINVPAVFPDRRYRDAYLAPFELIRERYADLHQFKMPPWMEAYRHGATLYVDPEPARLDDLMACVREYTSQYLNILARAEAIADPDRAAAVSSYHAAFKNDLVTKDRSQIMLGKVIGKQKAGRIFREVLT